MLQKHMLKFFLLNCKYFITDEESVGYKKFIFLRRISKATYVAEIFIPLLYKYP